MMPVLAFHIPYLDEWGVILIIGLLLFGKKLPEVGKNLGKGIVEFKKGLKGIEEEVEAASNAPASSNKPVTAAVTNYAFDPNTGEPVKPQIAQSIPTGAKFDPFTGKPIEAVATTNA